MAQNSFLLIVLYAGVFLLYRFLCSRIFTYYGVTMSSKTCLLLGLVLFALVIATSALEILNMLTTLLLVIVSVIPIRKNTK